MRPNTNLLKLSVCLLVMVLLVPACDMLVKSESESYAVTGVLWGRYVSRAEADEFGDKYELTVFHTQPFDPGLNSDTWLYIREGILESNVSVAELVAQQIRAEEARNILHVWVVELPRDTRVM